MKTTTLAIIAVVGSLMVLSTKARGGRPASIGEITQLFDLAKTRPQKSRFIADVTLTEPPLSRAQVLAELKLQNEIMAEADRYLTPSQKSKLQGVRSNTIVNESSGTRIFHVEEWYSGDKYRLDQTENSPINATYLKSHPNGYRDTYVNIRDPVFSPYSAFSVNHNLRDAQLTKDPKMKYSGYDLWRAFGLAEPAAGPLIVALADPHSLDLKRHANADFLKNCKIDKWKMQRIHDGTDPAWNLVADDEKLEDVEVTRACTQLFLNRAASMRVANASQ